MNNLLQQILSLFGNNGDNSTLNNAINTSEGTDYGYGLREDKTQKGLGYFGEIPMTGGPNDFMTELGSQMTEDEGEFHFPLIVPTLTREELDHLASGKEATNEIWKKAQDHAVMRRDQGKDPFAHREEEGKTPIPEYLKR